MATKSIKIQVQANRALIDAIETLKIRLDEEKDYSETMNDKLCKALKERDKAVVKLYRVLSVCTCGLSETSDSDQSVIEDDARQNIQSWWDASMDKE